MEKEIVQALIKSTQLIMTFSPLYIDKEVVWSTLHDQVAHNHKLIKEYEDALEEKTEGKDRTAEGDHEVLVSSQDG